MSKKQKRHVGHGQELVSGILDVASSIQDLAGS